jgi:hypothetical protein
MTLVCEEAQMAAAPAPGSRGLPAPGRVKPASASRPVFGPGRGQRRPGSAARAAAFGARVFVIDGRDVAAIDEALAE